jgi:hypothetical protein
MVGSQMGWNDTPFAIEHKTIVRTVAHYYAPPVGVGKCVGKTSRPVSAWASKNSIRLRRA